MRSKKKLYKLIAVAVAVPALWLTFFGANSSPIPSDNTPEVSNLAGSDTQPHLQISSPIPLTLSETDKVALTNDADSQNSVSLPVSTNPDTTGRYHPNSEQEKWLQRESSTTVISPSKQTYLEGGENRKPEINQAIYQALSETIATWELVSGVPINYSLPINTLFDDAENDLLSLKVKLTLEGVTAKLYNSLTLKGTPKYSDQTPVLTVFAKDSYHGDDESAWVSATFNLPAISSELVTSHPLEGGVTYRLESSQNFQNHYSIYEVVYCEAFKFVNQEVFYAKASSKTHCPEEDKLNLIGTYIVEGEQLIVSSNQSDLHAEQAWTVNKQYSSAIQDDLTNYFVKVESGRDVESYTMQKDKLSMEKRIQQVTGEYVYQFSWHDYLIPYGEDGYLAIQVANYIFNRGTDYQSPNNETFDSDLNIHAPNQSLSCNMLAHWYEFDVVAGQGEYGIEIISDRNPTNPAYSVECIEFPSDSLTGQISLAFNANYSPYDEFVEGEVYSFILRPKPQYADKVEELKLNMLYRHPR